MTVNTRPPEPTKINAATLVNLLQHPTPAVLVNDNGREMIRFANYHIEDAHLILDDTIAVSLPLEFINCTFTSEGSLYFDGFTCNENLVFEGCEFHCHIYIASGNFKKEFCIKYGTSKAIHISDGNFDAISISSYNIDNLWIGNAAFRQLEIGRDLKGYNIKKLVIHSEEQNVSGDIIVNEQQFEEISLLGHNAGRKVYFSKVKANIISITNFDNEGSLYFYDLMPKDSNSDRRYIQLVSCNLKNTRFFNADFSAFKEFIVVNSFITETLFISCKWSNNIRAIYGPGFESFEESLTTGRRITKNEVPQIKEAYRQLKVAMINHKDKILEHTFYAEELNYHNRELTWKNPFAADFWDKLILYFSKIFSNYGQSVGRPLVCLLAGHLILFLIAIGFNGFIPLRFSIENPTSQAFEMAFEKFFIYINPLRRLETSLSGYLIFIDLLMRIWSSYMLYNIVRATRRFIP